MRLFFHISDPKQRCKLFDSLVLLILKYASEVWAVDKTVGKSGKQLHWQFLKHVLGVRGSTAPLIVLAEFGRYPLHSVCFCRDFNGLHDREHCFLEPLGHHYNYKVQTWLQLRQSTALNIEDEMCLSTVIDNAKTLYQ